MLSPLSSLILQNQTNVLPAGEDQVKIGIQITSCSQGWRAEQLGAPIRI